LVGTDARLTAGQNVNLRRHAEARENSMSESVLYSLQNSVASITLNRPGELNSFTKPFGHAIRLALARAAEDAAVRAVVLSANGRGFSAGAELKGEFPSSEETLAQLEEEYAPGVRLISGMPKPVIAAVEGFATGIGASYVLACDIVLLGESAFLQVPFSKIGLVPDGGMCWQLATRLGHRLAFEIAMSGERLSADRCVHLGLANRVVPDGMTFAHAEELADRLAAAAPLALAGTKRLLREAAGLGLDATMSAEAVQQAKCIDSADFREGVQAFVEKRPPRFAGR
jgi:2-(1,2-epoxy-1,2-dihydrophenyl)acetyl-CoA isomerase